VIWLSCDKCGKAITHFCGHTRKYERLCKPCYDEELLLSYEEDLRTSKTSVKEELEGLEGDSK
jgi:hypothetical protein